MRPVMRGGLPDFRNLGVLLRVLLLVNVLALVTLLIAAETGDGFDAVLVMAAWLELPLMLVILLLYLLAPWLRRLSAASALAGAAAVVATAWAAAGLTYPLLGSDQVPLWRWLGWAAGAAFVCLCYFDYRALLYSPALSEARLQALTARIRPHFLFNALNGVLGVIRSDPARAEQALEELAELFRALMRDNRELVALKDELALCERYVDLEQLRLGERMLVRWKVDDGCRAALVPPLLLQPLVENAIYHGVEPAASQGEVVIRVARVSGELRMAVDNSICEGTRTTPGNHMALDNIRERLMLFFDLEARLEVRENHGRHRVLIRMPFRRAPLRTTGREGGSAT